MTMQEEAAVSLRLRALELSIELHIKGQFGESSILPAAATFAQFLMTGDVPSEKPDAALAEH